MVYRSVTVPEQWTCVAFLQAFFNSSSRPLSHPCYLRVHADFSERTFDKGQEVDCLDQVKKWCKARVIATNKDENMVYLHYEGWNDKWDEWIRCACACASGRWSCRLRFRLWFLAAPLGFYATVKGGGSLWI